VPPDVFDLAVIGGGVNGCGIARDAAGRGLSVVLLEKGDLGGATSSASTKLIHGGLRYLEHREFRLVREALREREVLLQSAPHLVQPLRFVLPHSEGQRPWPLLRLGIFLYDHMGGRRILPRSRALDLRHDPAGAPLQPEYTRALEYSDCWVDDARLVVTAARDAADRGADIRPRTACVAARREDGGWMLTADSRAGRTELRAQALVNAAGPWVTSVLSDVAGEPAHTRIRMVKGSHIVVPRLYGHDRCYIFQNRDGRICFAIPYQTDFTLIGTTDEDYTGDPAHPALSPAEADYLCAAVNAYFRQELTPSDIVWSYSGVRPLRDDGATAAQEATRDYVLELEGDPPLLSVFGGKITTFRRLAEAAMTRLAPYFPAMGPAWTADAHLPGGDLPWDGIPAFAAALAERHRLDPRTAQRLARAYGTRAEAMLASGPAGRDFGAGLTEREVAWLMAQEWADTADDILWRRTKLGLRFDALQRAELEAAMRVHA
jgi:glycerol-3-phosphate dehydrogenase